MITLTLDDRDFRAQRAPQVTPSCIPTISFFSARGAADCGLPSTYASMSSTSSRRASDSRSNAPADALTLVALSSLIRAPSRGRARTRTGTMQRLRNAWNAAALRMRGAYLTRNRRTAGSVMSLDNDLTIVCGDLTETCGPPLCFSLAHSPCLFSFSLYRDHPGS